MKLLNSIASMILLAFWAIMLFDPHKKTKTKKHNMSFFNAVQIALLIAAGPILLQLLKAATFTFATPLFWLCAIVYVGMFIWNIFMIEYYISKS